MTKYTIYPCTELTWLRLFRRIKKVAKESNMFISVIDIKPQEIPKEVQVKMNPLIHTKNWKKKTNSFVPNHITTIILENKQNEKRQKSLSET